MGTSREKLGNTGNVEASLRQTESSTQTGTTGTDDNGIVLVVLQQVRMSVFLVSIHLVQQSRLTITGYFSEM